jgi:hypothetical protein
MMPKETHITESKDSEQGLRARVESKGARVESKEAKVGSKGWEQGL